MDAIQIKKAKLTKTNCIEATYIDLDGNEISLKGNNIVHNDLKVRLANLVPYFAELTEQKEADRIDWTDLESSENVELLRKLEVTSVTQNCENLYPIVVLTGKRCLLTQKVLNLNTPATSLDLEDGYVHCVDLNDAVRAFFYEVEMYITQRKWGVIQQEIDFENEDDPFAGAPTATDDLPPIESQEEVPEHAA
jgi:hypothetical protein